MLDQHKKIYGCITKYHTEKLTFISFLNVGENWTPYKKTY